MGSASIIYQALIQSNCHAFLGPDVDIDIVSRLDAAGTMWQVYVLETTDGKRAAVLDASAPTLQRAFWELHRQSAQAVDRYVADHGFDAVPDRRRSNNQRVFRGASPVYRRASPVPAARRPSPPPSDDTLDSGSSSDSSSGGMVGVVASIHRSARGRAARPRPPVEFGQAERSERGLGYDCMLPEPGPNTPPGPRRLPTNLFGSVSRPQPAADVVMPKAKPMCMYPRWSVIITINWLERGEATFLDECALTVAAIQSRARHLLSSKPLEFGDDFAFGGDLGGKTPNRPETLDITVRKVKVDELTFVLTGGQDDLSMLVAGKGDPNSLFVTPPVVHVFVEAVSGRRTRMLAG